MYIYVILDVSDVFMIIHVYFVSICKIVIRGNNKHNSSNIQTLLCVILSSKPQMSYSKAESAEPE